MSIDEPTFVLSRLRRDLLLFSLFGALTILMTWPWLLHIRDAVSDPGDPYTTAWTLWWDYHQTFRDPLNLFHANIGFPYRYTLAFGEHEYGIAILFFPFFAAGLRPLTVLGIATLTGIAFCGYAAFRLARTVCGSNGIAWIAGIAFAFVPYRFLRLSSLHYLFTGWIPLLFEALILFARKRTWKRAVWLGIAFFMNGLSCLTWFLLTPLPLVVFAIVLVSRNHLWSDLKFWSRAGIAVCTAVLALLPFLIPYQKVSRLYGLKRTIAEAEAFSAYPVHWLVVDRRNRLWHGLGDHVPQNSELALFPGLLPLLFSLAGLMLVEPGGHGDAKAVVNLRRRVLLIFLDLLWLTALLIALLTIGYGVLEPRLLGITIFTATSPTVALSFSAIVLLVRCIVFPPQLFSRVKNSGWRLTISSFSYLDTILLGLILVILGFFGSLGVHLPVQRSLFEAFPIFQSMRVWARWSMFCYLGLSLLSGVGVERWAASIRRLQPGFPAAAVFSVVAVLFLFEQRVAPLPLTEGEVDPDSLTLKLKQTAMTGGIVELPANQQGGYFRYTLRAADHGRPLVTFANSFVTPTQLEIERLTGTAVIPDRFFDLLESIPASYLVLHYGTLTAVEEQKYKTFLAHGIANGRLRLIRTYEDNERKELYVVTKTEPNAQSEELP